jgi:hypothetical protein
MNAGPLRWVAGPCPGSISPAMTTQRIGTDSGWSAARRIARVGSPVGARRPWSSSPWVNSKGASRSPGAYASVRFAVSVRSQVVAAIESRRDRITSPNSTRPAGTTGG